jgi:hypothetical protein
MDKSLKILLSIMIVTIIITGVLAGFAYRGITQDLMVFEDGSYSGTVPFTQAWGD